MIKTIKTITLLLIISCFTVNANAISTKEVITKIPVFLLLAAIQLPTAMCKAINNTDINQIGSGSNVTLAEVFQHILTMEQNIAEIKQKVDAPSDFKIDQLTRIAISIVSILGLGGLLLIICISEKCKKRYTNNRTFFTKYGS